MSHYSLLNSRLLNGGDYKLDVSSQALTAWLVIYTIGQVLLLGLFITLVSAKFLRIKKRNPVMTNVILTGFFSAVSPCLLYYAGEINNPNPPVGICLTQATLKHGTGIMALVALLVLVIDIFMTTRSIVGSKAQGYHPLRNLILLATPYVIFVAFALPVLVMGIQKPELLERLQNLTYCSIQNDIYGNISTGLGVVITLVTVGLEVYTLYILRKSRAIKHVKESKQIDMSLLIRVCSFSGLQVIFIIVTAYNLTPGSPPAISFTYEALMTIGYFLVFGLQPDLIRTWLFMKPAFDASASTEFSESSSSSRLRSSVEKV